MPIILDDQSLSRLDECNYGKGFPEKPTVDQMWKFIDHTIQHNQLIPDRKTMTYEHVFSTHSKLCKIDLICNDIKQINVLRKEPNKEKSQETVV